MTVYCHGDCIFPSLSIFIIVALFAKNKCGYNSYPWGGDFVYSLLIRNTVCWYLQLKTIWKGKILKLKMNKERDFLLLIITLRAFLSLFSQNKIKYSPIRIKRLLNRFLAMSSLHWCKAICTKSLFPLSHSHQTMSKSFCTKYSEVSTLFSKTLKSITLALKVHLFFFQNIYCYFFKIITVIDDQLTEIWCLLMLLAPDDLWYMFIRLTFNLWIIITRWKCHGICKTL